MNDEWLEKYIGRPLDKALPFVQIVVFAVSAIAVIVATVCAK